MYHAQVDFTTEKIQEDEIGATDFTLNLTSTVTDPYVVRAQIDGPWGAISARLSPEEAKEAATALKRAATDAQRYDSEKAGSDD
jgi:preprotein translocase subunit SecD